jgi:hypothetical protein
MRRDPGIVCVALAMIVATTGCKRSGDDRTRLAQVRAQEEAVVRETDEVKRLATPQDSGHIIYDPPPDLSLQNLTRTKAPIVGLDKPLQPSEPAGPSKPPAH